MNLSRRSKPSRAARLAVLISLIIVNARSCGAESSGEYLQKAMIELQELNLPSNSLTMYDRLSSMNLGYRQGGYHDHNRYRKVSTNNVHQDILQKQIAGVPVEHVDMAHSAANSIAQYYAIRDSTAAASYPKVKQPEPLAFTRAELAALYKKALEKGSAISMTALTQALNAAGGNGNGNGNASPQADHPQLPVKPMYNYYFFPLKSFASELQRDHHQAALVPMYAATETAETTQKQLMNPLFVAIGTFISMALLFMMGVLFLPKLPHLELFNARVADNDDFLRLTTFVMNAIDGRNRWQNVSATS